MSKQYIASLHAVQLDIGLVVNTAHDIDQCEAETDDDAMAVFLARAKKRWPETQGWRKHDVIAQAVTVSWGR